MTMAPRSKSTTANVAVSTMMLRRKLSECPRRTSD